MQVKTGIKNGDGPVGGGDVARVGDRGALGEGDFRLVWRKPVEAWAVERGKCL